MITSYQANRILNLSFGNVSSVIPTTLYIGLSTNPIAFDGTGVVEPSGGSYARVAVANDKVRWGNAANGIITNLVDVQFPESTANWNTITHIFIADAASGGNILYYDALTPSRPVYTATTVLFLAGAISIQMNNS